MMHSHYSDHDSHVSYPYAQSPYLGELPRRAVDLRCDLVGSAGTTKSVERILWERVELNADLRDVAVDDDHLKQKDADETRMNIE
jgi:hypothetical protein